MPVTLKAEEHEAIMEKMEQKRNEKRLDVLTEKLNLTPEQKTGVKTVLDDKTKKMKDLQKEMVEKRKGIQDEADKQILSSLTDEQKAKYEDVKKEMAKEEAEQAVPRDKFGGRGPSEQNGEGPGGMRPQGGGRRGGGGYGMPGGRDF